MSQRQRHHGSHPEDARLFGAEAVPVLRRAAEEVVWLLGRGYPMTSAVTTVGNHHQLDVRQRVALSRSCCSEAQREGRRAREIPVDALEGRALAIDALNLVITVEVALGGGVLLRGRDGCLRDLAGLRGSYHPVDDTDEALDRIGAALAGARAASAAFFLDAPVSNSGRLRARLLARAEGWAVPVSAELVPDADPVVAAAECAVSSDAAVLDRCAAFCNLGARVVAGIPAARIVDLGV